MILKSATYSIRNLSNQFEPTQNSISLFVYNFVMILSGILLSYQVLDKYLTESKQNVNKYWNQILCWTEVKYIWFIFLCVVKDCRFGSNLRKKMVLKKIPAYYKIWAKSDKKLNGIKHRTFTSADNFFALTLIFKKSNRRPLALN